MQMLQIERDALGASGRVKRDRGEFNLGQILSLLRRQRLPIVGSITLAVVLGLLYLYTAPPIFSSTALLVLDTRKVQGLSQQQPGQNEIQLDTSTVDSQVEIISSDNVMLSVINDLKLLDDADFMHPPRNIVVRLIDALQILLATSGPQSEDERLRLATRSAVGILQQNLRVRRAGLTYVLEITYRSTDPSRAAQIANTFAESYIADQLRAKYEAIKRAGVWLKDRISELQEQANSAARVVQDYKNENNIVETSRGRMLDQQLAEVNSQLVSTHAQTAEAKARLDRIDEILRSGRPEASVNDSLHNEVVVKLRNELLQQTKRAAEWAKRYGPDHGAVLRIRDDIQHLRASLLEELSRLGETYRSEFEILKSREVSVQQSLSDLEQKNVTNGQASVRLRELESSAQTYRALYENFLQRYTEGIQQESFPITEARVITPASRPMRKSSPQTLLTLAMCIFGGGAAGLGLALVRENLDRVLRSPTDLENATGAECLASVPYVSVSKGAEVNDAAPQLQPDQSHWNTILEPFSSVSRSIRSFFETSGLGNKQKEDAQDLVPDRRHWHVVLDPLSRFSESIRSIKVGIDLARIAGPAKTVGVISTLPNEGKTTIAANLAALIATSGHSCLLIDADLRNPAFSTRMFPDDKLGLIELLKTSATLEQVVHRFGNLHVLPTVVPSRFGNTAGLLTSTEMRRLLTEVSNTYEYVILDLPPLAPVVDVRAFTPMIDKIILVVEWGRTRIEVVHDALDRLAPAAQRKILGVVLNKVNMKMMRRYESDKAALYYNKYYKRYGYADG